MLNEVELSILNLGYQIAPNSALIIFCIQLCIRDGLGKSLKKKSKKETGAQCRKQSTFYTSSASEKILGKGKREHGVEKD